jgi:xanthine dehydrogenase accessory factor
MSSLTAAILENLQQNQDLVLATIVSHQGSTPRTAGTKMAITRSGARHGTIGGGLVEAKVIKEADEIFRDGRPRLEFFDLTLEHADSLDMICGGRLEILLERLSADAALLEIFERYAWMQANNRAGTFITTMYSSEEGLEKTEHGIRMADGREIGFVPQGWTKGAASGGGAEARKVRMPDNTILLIEPLPKRSRLYLFGAGHVSQSTAHMASLLDFQVVVLDDRAEFANRERFPEADEIRVLPSFQEALQDLEVDRDSYLVIVTKGHSHDKIVLAQALRSQAGYIGMIGSKRKKETIFAALLKEGFSPEDLAKVHSPIGLQIKAQTPAEIAVSILAQIIEVRASAEETQMKGAA